MKLPFKLPQIDLSGIFSFSHRELRIILIIFISVIGIAVILIAGSLIIRGTKKPAAAGYSIPQSVDGSALSAEKPLLSDFMLYDDNLNPETSEYLLSREPQSRWSSDFTDQYWIDQKEITRELLEIELEKKIREIYADVP